MVHGLIEFYLILMCLMNWTNTYLENDRLSLVLLPSNPLETAMWSVEQTKTFKTKNLQRKKIVILYFKASFTESSLSQWLPKSWHISGINHVILLRYLLWGEPLAKYICSTQAVNIDQILRCVHRALTDVHYNIRLKLTPVQRVFA